MVAKPTVHLVAGALAYRELEAPADDDIEAVGIAIVKGVFDDLA